MKLAQKSEPFVDDNIKSFFKKEGYYLLKSLFSPEEMAQACHWLDSQDPNELCKSWTEKEPGVEIAIFSVIHKGDHPISIMANNQKMLQIASELMEEPVYIWSSKINFKAAWHGTAEYYHQDYVYWKDRGYAADKMMSCMIFLEKHSLENGGLHIMPGSHQYGFIEHQPFININGIAKNMIPAKTLNQLYAKHSLKAIDANPGDVLFFHASLVHGSPHNSSPFSRKVILSQLNCFDNQPKNVKENAKQFNLNRAKFEMEEAEKRLQWYRKKYEDQLKSEELLFLAPIPEEERDDKSY